MNAVTALHYTATFHHYYSFHSTTDRTKLFSHQMALDIIQRRSQHHHANNVSPDDHDNDIDDSVTAISPPTNAASELVITYCDIGCNEGDLTIEIIDAIARAFTGEHQTRHKRMTIIAHAIDIDHQLISRAQNKHAASRTHENSVTSHVHFVCGDITNADTFDSLCQNSSNGSVLTLEPTVHNDQFDLISLLSTTMWIHLNHGDEGLAQPFATTFSAFTFFARGAAAMVVLSVGGTTTSSCKATGMGRMGTHSSSRQRMPDLHYTNAQ